jgi:transcription initiation factor TFIID subunit 4
MHPQATQFQQSSQQLYGTSNPSAQAYPRSLTGSTPLRPIDSVSETQPSLHPHGTVPAKMGTPLSHPTMQHNIVRPMQQKKGAKANALTPGVNAKQD